MPHINVQWYGIARWRFETWRDAYTRYARISPWLLWWRVR